MPTNDSILLSAQYVLPAYAIWAVQKLENLNGLQYNILTKILFKLEYHKD
jgi:hypothetical protein